MTQGTVAALAETVGALAVCFTLLMEWVCSWPRAFGCCSIRLGHLRGS